MNDCLRRCKPGDIIETDEKLFYIVKSVSGNCRVYVNRFVGGIDNGINAGYFTCVRSIIKIMKKTNV